MVGFYVGTDGQDHGFIASQKAAKHGTLTGIAVADPTIPNVPGEPGATFVFSQILGINDKGIAVGYYGDSTTSQHGFLYNTHTGQYTFLDDPSEAFTQRRGGDPDHGHHQLGRDHRVLLGRQRRLPRLRRHSAPLLLSSGDWAKRKRKRTSEPWAPRSFLFF